MASKGKMEYVPVNDHIANRGFDELPFCYCDPNNTRIFWICNYDQDGKITSVVVNSNEKKGNDRGIGYLDDMDAAIKLRNDLIKHGWIEFQLPQITVSQPSSENATTDRQTQPTLNRRQKRYLEKMKKKK